MRTRPPLPARLWGSLPPEVRGLILALRAEVAELQAKVQSLQQQVQTLQDRLNRNSTNSSRPPSSDPPSVKRRPPRPPSSLRTGGQPGHVGHNRPLLPPDRTLVLKPTQCRRCGTALQGTDPQPLRRQVLELPPLRPEVTEYQVHR